MKKITILVPAYNEAENIPLFHRELCRILSTPSKIENLQKHDVADSEYPDYWIFNPDDYSWEFLFVNDGSKDDTLNILRQLHKQDPRVHFVNLSRNFGKENAMLAGMDHATGDAVIIMDADLQDPVELVPEMIFWWEQGFDDVYGRRAARGKESWTRKRLSLAFYNILQKSTRVDVLPNVGDFRLLDRRVVNAISKLRETQRYTKGLFCWVGYNKKELLFNRADRGRGKSSFRLTSLLNLAVEGITSFTTAPLRIATLLGFIVSIYAMFHLIFVLTKTLIFGDPVQGFPTLLSVILFIGGVQLIAIGIIGEYVGRIFNETKNRPAYIVESIDENRL